MKKFIPVAFVYLFVVINSLAQTNISGVINIYTKVTAVPVCNPCTPACSTLTVSSSAGFAAGDKVLIIQMQGATANTPNNASFGSISNYDNAGNYEYVVISSVAGTTLTFTTSLLNSYDATGSTQIVKVPVYASANVNGPLIAATWNGNTGGVLVFEVTGTLTLNANISVDTLGFRGGLGLSNGFSYPCGLTDYFYGGSIYDNAAPKGEGIANVLGGYELGKGAWTNGGGGGNSHNGGGGGGSNGGDGGIGGQDYCSAGSVLSGGIGGYPLNTSSGAKIFMGGGGGAGHQNNNAGTNGGKGGGIILIKAAQIIGNGFSIKSNGANAMNTYNGGNDGGGGGGAGGSIMLNVPVFTTNLIVSANGGKGADETFSSGGHAPGGGSGGGNVCLSVASIPANLTVTVNKGVHGIITMDGTAFGSTDGSNGLINLSCPALVAPGPKKITANVGSDVQLCNPISVTLDAGVVGPWYTYQWKKDGAVITGATGQTLTITGPGQYTVLVSSAGCIDGKDTVNITTAAATPNNAIFCAPPPKVVPLSVTGTGKYKWWTLATGGSVLATGSSYNPTLSATSTFYVEDTAVFSKGGFTPVNMLSGFTVRGGASNTYMAFNAVAPFTLDSVTMFIRTYNTNVDNMVINLMQKGNPTPLATKSLIVTGPCNCQVDKAVQFYLGFSIPIGTDYYLAYASGSVNVHWDNSGASYPYTLPGIVSITQPVDGSGNYIGWASTSYGFFYNWKISSGTLCLRVPVVATLNCPAPVSLIDFKAIAQNDQVELEWYTASENNSDYFIIERSEDGKTYGPIGKVKAKGFSSTLSTYKFSDKFSGTTAYYRLVQYDLDGTFQYSNVEKANFAIGDGIILYPNPFSNEINVLIKSNTEDRVLIKIVSVLGQELYTDNKETNIPFQIGKNLDSGIYLLYYSSPSTSQVFKVIKN